MADIDLIQHALDEACGERMPHCYKGPLNGRPHPRGHGLRYMTPGGIPAFYRFVAMMRDTVSGVYKIEYWQYVGHIYIENCVIDMPPDGWWREARPYELESRFQ